MSKTMLFVPIEYVPSCVKIVVSDEMASGDAVAPTLPGTWEVYVGDDPVDTLIVVAPEDPEDVFTFDIYNEAGATPTDIPGLRVSINGGAYQTPAAAGLTLVGFDTVTRKLEFSGMPGGVTSCHVVYEQEQPGEPYSANGSVAGTYVRGSITPANTALPGVSLAPTLANSPIAATIG
jgi:hypothetical protein